MSQTAVRLTERSIQSILYWRHRSSALCILPNWTPHLWYECDLFVLTAAMHSIEYEIKVAVSDFKADFDKLCKHNELARKVPIMNRPTRFFYVMPEGLVHESDIPPYAGLIYIYPLRRVQVIRPAPRLRSEPHSDGVLKAMRRTSCYRFWNERIRHDNYVSTVNLERKNNGHVLPPEARG